MKSIVHFFLLVLLTTACTKDSLFDEYGYYGIGKAKLNGKDMEGTTGVFAAKPFCAPEDTCVAIKILYHNETGAQIGDLTFNFIPLKRGKYTLNYSPNWGDIEYKLIYAVLTSGGHVLTGIYYLTDQNDENYIEITELNTQTGDIKGNFQAVAVRHPAWTPAGVEPDTIRITDGTFYGRVYRKR